jgi:hypothetical protein
VHVHAPLLNAECGMRNKEGIVFSFIIHHSEFIVWKIHRSAFIISRGLIPEI